MLDASLVVGRVSFSTESTRSRGIFRFFAEIREVTSVTVDEALISIAISFGLDVILTYMALGKVLQKYGSTILILV